MADSAKLKSQCQKWLSEHALPLWLERGIAADGSFVENLSREGMPLTSAQRAMVQGRQIYSFSEAVRLKLLTKDQVQPIVARAAERLIEKYSLDNGAFAHAVEPSGVKNPQVDLYAQAFALFGLANAFEITGNIIFRERALKLLAYLESERRLPSGTGYSEYVHGQIAFEANPHMHLFEAALAWMQAEKAHNLGTWDNGEWRQLADEISGLAVGRFVDKSCGMLCEHFDNHWKPVLEAGHFVFEPGHHHEWAWLLLKYSELGGVSVGEIPRLLFDKAEQYGIDPKSGLVYDEVLNNGRVKKRSSRFWPQSERIKAALSLAELAESKEEDQMLRTCADDATEALFKFLNGLKPGLWEDTLQADGKFTDQPVKASSLYHIICAMSEYIRKR